MTSNAKDIMKGILGAYGVISAIGLVIGGAIVGVSALQTRKARKEFEKSLKEFED